MIDTFLMTYIVVSRIFELIISKKNTKNLLKLGGSEYYKFHYKFIVLFHIIFIAFFLTKSFLIKLLTSNIFIFL